AVPVGGVQAAAYLLAVKAVPVEFGIREAEIEIKRAIHLARRQLILEETERARLTAEFDQASVVAGFGHQINRTSQGVSPKAQCIGAFIDLDIFGREQFERLEIAEAIGVPIGETVEQHVHTPQMKIVAQPGATDGELAFVRGAEAWT